MLNPARGIRLRASARTNKGQVRENNEDSVHLWSHEKHKMVLAIVADGMGGAAAGEEASRLAVDTIHQDISDGAEIDLDLYTNLDEDTLVDRLRKAVRDANDRIVQRSLDVPEFKGMGTTLTMVFARNNHAVVAHVGDSRAYMIDGLDGHITQITSDHSFVQALVDAGHITAEEADEHPMRNVLYRALGQSTDIDIDVYYNGLQAGDRLVLCSDGLTLHVKPQEISEVVQATRNPDEASDRLIKMANERGGKDNISVIVIAVEADEEATSEIPQVAAASAGEEHDDDTLILQDRESFGIRVPKPDKPLPGKSGAEGEKPSTELARVVASDPPPPDAEGRDPQPFDQ